MNLPKAREVLTNIQNYTQPGGPPTEAMAQVRAQEHDALQIGIEAIDREQKHRDYYSMRDPELLPSETED